MSLISDFDKYELIELIYSAAAAPENWRNVVARMGELLPHGAISFQHFRTDQRAPAICIIENWMEGANEAYLKRYASMSPWLAIHKSSSIGKPYFTDDSCPASTYLKTEFFSDFIKPYKVMCGAVGIKISDNADSMTALGVNYQEEHGTRASVPIANLLTSLAPHLRKAIELGQRLEDLEARSGSTEGLIDAMKCPAILVSEGGQVRHMNAAAVAMVQEGRGLFITPNGCVRLQHSHENEHLHALIRKALSLDDTSTLEHENLLVFSVKSGAGPNAAFVTPIVPGPSRSMAFSSLRPREALITFHFRNDRPLVPKEALRMAFGLTQAESETVLAIAGGAQLTEYAEQIGRSLHTVRLHLKRALAKADCHSQTELVALVLKLLERPL